MYKNIVSYTIILFAMLAIIGCNGERKNTHISPFGVISAAPKDNSSEYMSAQASMPNDTTATKTAKAYRAAEVRLL